MSSPRPPTSPVVACLALLVMSACGPSPGGPSSPTPGPSSAASSTPLPTPLPTPDPTPEPTATPVVPDNALLPNLVMEPLDEWMIEVRDGRRLLRMTTIFSNYGDGDFELRGSRGTEDEVVVMDQVVYTASGGFRRVPDVVDARYAGDGHDHWHAQQVVTLELSPVADPASIRNGNKVHFCFFDNVRTNEALEAFSPDGYYERAWCGTPSSDAIRMGLSVGWGDRYGWDFAGQWIDITGVAGGTYTLRATVDWANTFYETDDTDNCTMSTVQIPATGVGRIVSVQASDQPCS